MKKGNEIILPPAAGGKKRRPRAGGTGGRVRPDRRRKRKSCTKAELKRRARTRAAQAVRELGIYNRIDMLPAKRAHLEKAIGHLEAVLEARAGRHLFRRQLALCREAMRDYERGTARARSHRIELMISADYL